MMMLTYQDALTQARRRSEREDGIEVSVYVSDHGLMDQIDDMETYFVRSKEEGRPPRTKRLKTFINGQLE